MRGIGRHDPEAYTWEDWERDMRAKYPVRFFLSRTMPRWLGRWHHRLIETPLYWLRTHTINRYHLVDLRNDACDYRWGWIDRSEAVLYACFNLLRDFVEKENGLNCHVDWQATTEHSHAHAEMTALYRWWKTERKAEWAEWNEKCLHATYDEQLRLENKDDEMLRRLIAIRGFMWT